MTSGNISCILWRWGCSTNWWICRIKVTAPHPNSFYLKTWESSGPPGNCHHWGGIGVAIVEGISTFCKITCNKIWTWSEIEKIMFGRGNFKSLTFILLKITDKIWPWFIRFGHFGDLFAKLSTVSLFGLPAAEKTSSFATLNCTQVWKKVWLQRFPPKHPLKSSVFFFFGGPPQKKELAGDSKWPFHPLVGGHLTFPKGHLTIPKRSLWITRWMICCFVYVPLQTERKIWTWRRCRCWCPWTCRKSTGPNTLSLDFFPGTHPVIPEVNGVLGIFLGQNICSGGMIGCLGLGFLFSWRMRWKKRWKGLKGWKTNFKNRSCGQFIGGQETWEYPPEV